LASARVRFQSAPAVSLLAKALDHRAINGHGVTLDGEPTRYHVDGEPSIEGGIVALAFRLGMGSPR